MLLPPVLPFLLAFTAASAAMDPNHNQSISSHVLDIANGHPASGVKLEAYIQENGEWKNIGETVTASTGRVDSIHPSLPLTLGIYKIVFHTQDYFAQLGQTTFYPIIEASARIVIFNVTDVSQHYHVPLTLSNYGYSTYKGQ